MRLRAGTTYNFSEKYNVFSPHDKNSSCDVAVFLPNMDTFNGSVQHQIGCWKTTSLVNFGSKSQTCTRYPMIKRSVWSAYQTGQCFSKIQSKFSHLAAPPAVFLKKNLKRHVLLFQNWQFPNWRHAVSSFPHENSRRQASPQSRAAWITTCKGTAQFRKIAGLSGIVEYLQKEERHDWTQCLAHHLAFKNLQHDSKQGSV